MITSATSPLVTNHFSPRIRQPPPSPSGAAVVSIADGSEPASASVTAYASCASPRSIGRSQRSICSSVPTDQTLYAFGTCQESALVERPSCSSTSAHARCDQPWPPCSVACSPPASPASSPAARIAATSPAGSRPPAASAASSRGISCSSTKRRARSAIASTSVSRATVVIVCRSFRSPGSPSASASWLATTSRTSADVAAAGRCSASACVSRSHASQSARRPCSTSRSAAARSARTSASGGGVTPLLNAARASGSSRSGSGVSDNQVSSRKGIDSDNIMRLITKSGRP